MKRLTVVAAFALMLAPALGGCSTFQSLIGGGSVADANQSAVATAEKGLTLAHLAYQGVGVALKAAADNGTLKGADAATAQKYFDEAGDALTAADDADAAANAQGVDDAVARAETLIADIYALIHKS